ncbi:hypothetical protein [Janthinobacterium svalbardensis]
MMLARLGLLAFLARRRKQS